MRSGTLPGLPLPEPCSGDRDRPVADASDDIDGATEGLNVPADGVHLGDLVPDGAWCYGPRPATASNSSACPEPVCEPAGAQRTSLRFRLDDLAWFSSGATAAIPLLRTVIGQHVETFRLPQRQDVISSGRTVSTGPECSELSRRGRPGESRSTPLWRTAEVQLPFPLRLTGYPGTRKSPERR